MDDTVEFNLLVSIINNWESVKLTKTSNVNYYDVANDKWFDLGSFESKDYYLNDLAKEHRIIPLAQYLSVMAKLMKLSEVQYVETSQGIFIKWSGGMCSIGIFLQRCKLTLPITTDGLLIELVPSALGFSDVNESLKYVADKIEMEDIALDNVKKSYCNGVFTEIAKYNRIHWGMNMHKNEIPEYINQIDLGYGGINSHYCITLQNCTKATPLTVEDVFPNGAIRDHMLKRFGMEEEDIAQLRNSVTGLSRFVIDTKINRRDDVFFFTDADIMQYVTWELVTILLCNYKIYICGDFGLYRSVFKAVRNKDDKAHDMIIKARARGFTTAQGFLNDYIQRIRNINRYLINTISLGDYRSLGDKIDRLSYDLRQYYQVDDLHMYYCGRTIEAFDLYLKDMIVPIEIQSTQLYLNGIRIEDSNPLQISTFINQIKTYRLFDSIDIITDASHLTSKLQERQVKRMWVNCDKYLDVDGNHVSNDEYDSMFIRDQLFIKTLAVSAGQDITPIRGILSEYIDSPEITVINRMVSRNDAPTVYRNIRLDRSGVDNGLCYSMMLYSMNMIIELKSRYRFGSVMIDTICGLYGNYVLVALRNGGDVVSPKKFASHIQITKGSKKKHGYFEGFFKKKD